MYDLFKSIILTLSIVLCGINVPAQECGVGFGQVTVANKTGKVISKSTIEIIGRLPYDDYDDPTGRKVRTDPIWLKYAEIRQGLNYYIIPPKFVKQVTDLTLKLDRNLDFCGNPLKQRAGVTKVKTKNGYPVNRNEPNFGYCTGETKSTPYILKISAPKYIDSYFIGNFLGGCYSHYKFVLSASKR
jgi:hypothetical protein